MRLKHYLFLSLLLVSPVLTAGAEELKKIRELQAQIDELNIEFNIWCIAYRQAAENEHQNRIMLADNLSHDAYLRYYQDCMTERVNMAGFRERIEEIQEKREALRKEIAPLEIAEGLAPDLVSFVQNDGE